MNIPTFNELYEEYTETRRLKLTEGQFLAFITYYPALLVAKTDGEVDEQEWSLLQALANHLVKETVAKDADKEEIKDYQTLFFNEFQYLLDNLDRWDRKFMRVLQQLMAKQPELVESVAAVIYTLADASKGVCEKERTMIEYLRNELRIKDFCVNIKAADTPAAAQAAKQLKWQMFFSIW
ncbi:MAG: hypothetical protein MUD08_10015 [Cytophagales bacterium]|nr:hypothetical protein [Cytophagales bacterium]